MSATEHELAAAPPRASTTFTPPPGSDAASPPERRGLTRDGVRLLAASPAGTSHHVFRDLASLLAPGDLLVVNTSKTLPPPCPSRRGEVVPLHVSTVLDDGSWVVEPRLPDGSGPDLRFRRGDVVRCRTGRRHGSSRPIRTPVREPAGCGVPT